MYRHVITLWIQGVETYNNSMNIHVARHIETYGQPGTEVPSSF